MEGVSYKNDHVVQSECAGGMQPLPEELVMIVKLKFKENPFTSKRFSGCSVLLWPW